MKRSYSSHNLLQQKMDGREAPKSFLTRIMGDKKVITIELPWYDYYRGEIFISDIKELNKDIHYSLDVGMLMYMLYDEFMYTVLKGKDHKLAAIYLSDGKKKYIDDPAEQRNKKKEKRVMKAVKPSVFEFEYLTVDDDENDENDEDDIAEVNIRIKSEELMRGEVMLYDLEPYFNGNSMTVEDVFVIRYCNFMEEIKKRGNSVMGKVVQAFLERIGK